MFTFIGAVFIIGATTFFGLSAFWRLNLRLRVLQNIVSALGQMEYEITERLLPLPEMLELLIAESKAPLKHFFVRVEAGMREVGLHSFSKIWNDALANSEELLLKKEELTILEDLGKTLGRYEVQKQKSAFHYAKERMGEQVKIAQEEKRTQGKMHAVLGFAAGFFVVFILM